VIDLHCHLLPGIDDGAGSDLEALELARRAVAEGITHAVLTPHFHPGRYENSWRDVQERARRLQSLLTEHGIALRLGVAGELRAGSEVMDAVVAGDLPVLGNWQGHRVILLEFPHSHLPLGSERLVAWLLRAGVLPLIAHPERNKDVLRDIERIAPLVAEGALLQVTADSMWGGFGPPARERAIELLERGWVTVLASDAHNLANRPPRLERGRAAAAEIVGEFESWQLVRDRPGTIAAAQWPAT